MSENCDWSEHDNCDAEDEADGFFTGNRGRYRPRDREWQDTLKEALPQTEDSYNEGDTEAVRHLIITTDVDKWRPVILKILTHCKVEANIRQSLTYLHEQLRVCLQAVSDNKTSTEVMIPRVHLPHCVTEDNCAVLLEGLGFEPVEPASEKYVKLQQGSGGIVELQGLCVVLRSLLYTSYLNLLLLTSLNYDSTRKLSEIMDGLCSGSGISPSFREDLNSIVLVTPSLLRCLGFLFDDFEALQWQFPENRSEFNRLCMIILGLFGTTS